MRNVKTTGYVYNYSYFKYSTKVLTANFIKPSLVYKLFITMQIVQELLAASPSESSSTGMETQSSDAVADPEIWQGGFTNC